MYKGVGGGFGGGLGGGVGEQPDMGYSFQYIGLFGVAMSSMASSYNHLSR